VQNVHTAIQIFLKAPRREEKNTTKIATINEFRIAIFAEKN